MYLYREILKPKCILRTPQFHHLAISKANKVDSGQDSFLACGRKSDECAEMGPAQDKAKGDPTLVLTHRGESLREVIWLKLIAWA